MIVVNIIVQGFIQTPRGFNNLPPQFLCNTDGNYAKVEFLWWTRYTLHVTLHLVWNITRNTAEFK